MTELLEAAKTMVEWFDSTTKEDAPVDDLRDAVERAEKHLPIGFYEYWRKEKFRWDKNLQRDVKALWTAAQQAERERIRSRAKLAAEKTFKAGGYCVGPQHYLIDQFVDALLEDGDDE